MYLLRRLIGGVCGRLTRHSRPAHVHEPAAVAAVAAAVRHGRGQETAPMGLTSAGPPRELLAPPPRRAVVEVEQWLDRCEQEFGVKTPVPGSLTDWLEQDPIEALAEPPARRGAQEAGLTTHASGSVTDWLERDPFEVPAGDQQARPDQGWVPPHRPAAPQGTFVERLDAFREGLDKLEAFVLKCTREEEAAAKQLEAPAGQPRELDKARESTVLQWRPRTRGKTTAA